MSTYQARINVLLAQKSLTDLAMHPLDGGIALGPVQQIQVDVVRVEMLQRGLHGVGRGRETQFRWPHLAGEGKAGLDCGEEDIITLLSKIIFVCRG